MECFVVAFCFVLYPSVLPKARLVFVKVVYLSLRPMISLNFMDVMTVELGGTSQLILEHEVAEAKHQSFLTRTQALASFQYSSRP